MEKYFFIAMLLFSRESAFNLVQASWLTTTKLHLFFLSRRKYTIEHVAFIKVFSRIK